jgi:hypothetical protein
MSQLKKLTLALVLLAGLAVAQVPNCQINFGPWTDTAASAASFNGVTQCAYWVITYQVTGFSAISLAFESATGVQSGPGSFGNFTGTVVTGINPNTSVSCATPTNCTSTFTGTPGWFRVNFASHTGSGSIQGTLQGYKTGYPLGGNSPGGAGCPGTAGTPCVVDGVTAAGSPPTTPPVLIAGQDGTNIRTVLTGADGSVVPAHGSPVQADGVTAVRSPTDDLGNPLFYRQVPFGFDGTNFDRLRNASLVNMPTAGTTSGANSIGARITEKGSRWVVNSHPATSSQATASIAAEAGVRHVVDCVTFAEASGGAVTGATHFISLRDGATGAGTILIQWVAAIPTAAGTGIQGLVPQSFCGLNLVGTTNTAMTFEFDAGVTNAIETVSISGFNVN